MGNQFYWHIGVTKGMTMTTLRTGVPQGYYMVRVYTKLDDEGMLICALCKPVLPGTAPDVEVVLEGPMMPVLAEDQLKVWQLQLARHIATARQQKEQYRTQQLRWVAGLSNEKPGAFIADQGIVK